MDIKLFPIKSWQVSTKLNKEEILKKVSDLTVSKSWKISMKGLFNNVSFTSQPTHDGFILVIGNYGLSYAKNPLRPPVDVRFANENNLTLLNCTHKLSNGTFARLAMFYSIFIIISYFMGFKDKDWVGIVIPLGIIVVHYCLVLYNFNKQLFNYEFFIAELVKD
ncbi:hypothetical protein [Chitinophaga silvisoli]|uniref:Uncharacterized protein n=1 Tax=Chitinophaga silvisoli TaxID=2291814 RepID=A0A3E1NS51_9BACT|nr:hypothetical protein [Chitinophaga silvisoli]RFM30740.1 hypothetical protein DXN04_32005 [Chitinophaga silvisoli]